MVTSDEILKRINLNDFYRSELGQLSKPNQKGWVTALCKFHEDKNPSLRVNVRTGTFRCMACGARGGFIKFYMDVHGCDFPTALIELSRFAGMNGTMSGPLKTFLTLPNEMIKPKMVATYDYVNQDGELIFQVCRFEPGKDGKKKSFLQRRPDDNGGWIWNLEGVTQTLYNLPDLIGKPSTPVFVVEGEKDADKAKEVGLLATTNAAGAGKWTEEHSKFLKDRDVIIIPDDDDAGKSHAREIAQSLLGIAASIKVLRLPNPTAKKSFDLSDFIDSLSDPHDASDRLLKMADNAQPYQLRETTQNDGTSGMRTFKLVPVGNIQIRAPEWLIRDLIEKDSLSLVFGDPGCGKSFLGIDIACCIAAGCDFHGLQVKQGPVFYIAGEGHNGLGRRFKAWSIRNKIDLKEMPLFVSTISAGLCDSDQVEQVSVAFCSAAEKYGPPFLIVIDTLARNFGPGDENSTADMTTFIAACDRLRGRYQSGVLIIHHSGHSDKSRARGAMALKGALDAEYRLEKDSNSMCRLESTKMKDFDSPKSMAFVIRSVELSVLEDGTHVTSAILEDTQYEPCKPKRKGRREGRGRCQSIALEVLQGLYDKHYQEEESNELYSNYALVAFEDWRVACMNEGISRQTFFKVKRALSEQRLIQIQDGYVGLNYKYPSIAVSPLSPV